MKNHRACPRSLSIHPIIQRAHTQSFHLSLPFASLRFSYYNIMTAVIAAEASRESSEVCHDESLQWVQCAEQLTTSGLGMREGCPQQVEQFDVCVAQWRKLVGPHVRIAGPRPGCPPPQCQRLSCIVEACLAQTQYDFKKCAAPTQAFKYCVKQLYGSEYVM